jgi:hypothetical protein
MGVTAPSAIARIHLPGSRAVLIHPGKVVQASARTTAKQQRHARTLHACARLEHAHAIGARTRDWSTHARLEHARDSEYEVLRTKPWQII